MLIAVTIVESVKLRHLLPVLALAFAPLSPAQTPAWKPARNVEIVVGVGPGGGIDRTARVVQKILQDEKLIDVPASVVNRPGGGGTIAQAALNQRQGDAHVWEITATSLLTNHITGRSALGHRDFTPIAMLSDEYIGFLVRADSPLKSGRDLLDALKADPEALPIGIATAAGNTNHIAAGLAAKISGGDVKKLKVVVFGSGGESMTALLGGHVRLVVTPSANAISHLQSGRMRVLAIASPARLEGALAAVPTWREQRADIVVANWRPAIGPRGWAPAQVAYWEEALARVTRSEEWKSDVARSGAVTHYMGSRELAAFFDQQYAQFRAILGDLGLAKNP
jgi:putative tricarboxylic transport membrane protein